MIICDEPQIRTVSREPSFVLLNRTVCMRESGCVFLWGANLRITIFCAVYNDRNV
jgi:hypothetical protein